MRFVSNYTVSYRGQFYSAGQPFEIDERDAEEMKEHGTVEIVEKISEAEAIQEEGQEEQPQRRPGRPRKQD